jgi:hypothetical protein
MLTSFTSHAIDYAAAFLNHFTAKLADNANKHLSCPVNMVRMVKARNAKVS